MKKLVIIDGKSVFYRGYYAMKNLSTSDGRSTGGVYGFASLAFEIIRKLKPDYVIVAWDKKGTSISRRKEIFEGYKAGRKKSPDDFYEQIPTLRRLLKALGWPLMECDNYEADDILGTLSVQANKIGVEANLITSDLDMLQLIDENTKVFAMKKGFSDIEEFDLEYFENKYGLKQAQFLDLKSLQGDSSDNIPGVPGIGPKTATTLLQDYLTLDGIYENIDKIKPAWKKKLEEGKDLAYMSRELAEIWTDAPVEFNPEKADIHNFNYSEVLAVLRDLEFGSLVRKIPAEMKPLDYANINEDQASLFDKIDSEKDTELPKLKEVGLDEFISLNNKEIFIAIFGDELFLASPLNISKVQISSLNSDNIEKIGFLGVNKVVFFDAKSDFWKLYNLGVDIDFNEIYDLKQMEFLLNALIKDKTLGGILGFEIDENNIFEYMSAMVRIYNSQQARLASEPKILKIANELDFPLAKVLFKMEQKGVKIDLDFFSKESKYLASHIEEIEKEIFELAGREFNVASPLQLSKVLFEELELPTKGIKKSRTGFSTGQKELDKLRSIHPIIEKIEKFREFSKLKNTYIDTFPKLADSNNRLHTTFNQDITTTGRLSSTNPNLQNIPIRTEIGRKIREGFIAGDGKILVSADYSQFELRLAAALSNDIKLIETFNSGSDIHAETASEVFKVAPELVSKEQRRAAKIINFSVLYGTGAHSLAQQTGSTYADAKRYIEDYFEVHKPIKEYLDNILVQAKNEGFVETLFGRKRPTPDVNSSNHMIREMAKRAAQNMPIQGTEADLMKKAMLSVDKKITRAGLGEQILQIHDSILIETTIEQAEEVARILKNEMENVAPEIPVKLKVDIGIGKNWSLI